jgi:hypothetical protein
VVVGATVVVVVVGGTVVVVVVGGTVVVVVVGATVVVVVVGATVVVVVVGATVVVVVVGGTVVVVVVVVVVGASVVVVVEVSSAAMLVVVKVFGGMAQFTGMGVPGGAAPMFAVVVSVVAPISTVAGPAGACTSTVIVGVMRSPGATGPGSPSVIVVLPAPRVAVPEIGVPLFRTGPLVVIEPGTNVPPVTV